MKKRFAMGVAMVAALSMVGAPAAFAQDVAPAEEPTGGGEGPLFPSLEHLGAVSAAEPVAGKTLEEWAHELMLWAQAPADQNAMESGDCSLDQGDEVFFLQNTWFGQTAIIDCTIPAGAYILVNPGGGFGLNTLPEETPEELKAFGRQMSQFQYDPEVIVDGVHVPVGPAAWVDTEPFDWTPPEGHWSGHTDPTTAHYAGWFVMLEPLEPGVPHTIVLSDDTIGPVEDADGNIHYTESTATSVFDVTVEGEAEADDMAEEEAADDEAASE